MLQVCKNPRSPGFNHYLFESVAALIRHAGSSNPAMIDTFEQLLFPAFNHVLQQVGIAYYVGTQHECTHTHMPTAGTLNAWAFLSKHLAQLSSSMSLLNLIATPWARGSSTHFFLSKHLAYLISSMSLLNLIAAPWAMWLLHQH